jgi:hypothetical protein
MTKKYYAVLVFLIITFILFVISYRISSKPLIEISHRVVTVDAWCPTFMPKYYWLSDHELLFYRSLSSDKEMSLHRYDTKLHEDRINSNWENIQRTGGDPWELEIVPNSKWMCWTANGKFFSAALDASSSSNCPLYGTAYRMGDGANWLEFIRSSPTNIYTKVITHAIGQSTPLNTHKVYEQCLINSSGDMDDVVLSTKNLLLSSTWKQRYEKSFFEPLSSVTIFKGDITSSMIPHKYTIRLPEISALRGFEFSPDGEHIAWAFVFSRINPWMRFQRWLFPSFTPHPQSTIEIWTSNIDGSHMHTLGYIDLSSYKEGDVGGFCSMAWTPDGKHLSFVYDSSLWITKSGF